MNSSTRQRVLRTHMLSRFVIPTSELLLLIRSRVTHRKRTNLSVSPSQIGEGSSSAEHAAHRSFPTYLFTPLSHPGLPPHVSVCRSRACLTAIRVPYLGKTEVLCLQMPQFEILVGHRLTRVCHGTVRSSEILLEVSVHELRRCDMFHAWTTVIQLELWGQTRTSGAALCLRGYLYTIVGVFSFQNKQGAE